MMHFYVNKFHCVQGALQLNGLLDTLTDSDSGPLTGSICVAYSKQSKIMKEMHCTFCRMRQKNLF
jgi:hypothetical protein